MRNVISLTALKQQFRINDAYYIMKEFLGKCAEYIER